MIFCKELNQSYSTPRAMFAALKANKRVLIDGKKATIKTTDTVSFHVGRFENPEKLLLDILNKGEVSKTPIGYGDYIYPVINTINFLDSHKDLHLRDIWNKSVKEQQGSIYYTVDHKLEVDKIISYPDEVEMMIKEMSWEQLGFPFPGTTQTLVFKSKLTEASNNAAFQAIKAGKPLQNSVRMRYIRLELAINSTDESFKEEKRAWDKYSSLVANKEALEDGYFWPVHEAQVFREGACVLLGSNEATPIEYQEPKHIQPLSGTEQKHAAAGTGKLKELNSLLQKLKTIK